MFKASHTMSDPLIIGASKTCVGHTESAAGLVGVAKALLSFKHLQVPGLVHLSDTNLNPEIDCTSVPLIIPWENTPLKRVDNQIPRHAMVLSVIISYDISDASLMFRRAYGFAGTISGTVLESSHDFMAGSSPVTTGSPHAIFAVSAKTPQGLRDYLQAYIDYCCDAPSETFQDICFTATTSREHYKHRFACVAKDMHDLIKQLKAAQLSQHSRPTQTHLVLGFPGQGSQYQGMARDLADANSDFKAILTRVTEKAAEITGFSLVPSLLDADGSPDVRIDESQHAQVCVFVYQYSFCRWLKNLGITPDAVLGHSIGEIAAAGVNFTCIKYSARTKAYSQSLVVLWI